MDTIVLAIEGVVLGHMLRGWWEHLPDAERTTVHDDARAWYAATEVGWVEWSMVSLDGPSWF